MGNEETDPTNSTCYSYVLKKSGYKYQIEQELLGQNWEIIEVGSSEEWWDDEHWKIQLKFDSNVSFFLCFIVDPQFDRPRKKGQGIYTILASTEFPVNWNDNNHGIGSISMAKGKFDTKLTEFMANLDHFKRRKAVAN